MLLSGHPDFQSGGSLVRIQQFPQKVILFRDDFCIFEKLTGSGHPDCKSGGSLVRIQQFPQIISQLQNVVAD